MKVRSFLLDEQPDTSASPSKGSVAWHTQNERFYIDDCAGILRGICVEVVSANMTSRNPEAECIEVFDRIVLDERQAAWLRDELTRWIEERKAEDWAEGKARGDV